MGIINFSRKIELVLSFISALLIASQCGSQYLFSAYSTSIAEKLGFTSVQINTIGSSANYGVFLFTPLFGYLVDHCSSRLIPMIASFTLFTGYFCMAMTYQGYFKSKSVILCALYMFLTGLASSSAYLASLSTIVTNFKSYRGIALGAPVALFGSTAFIFSQINSLVFKGDTYHFLLFVAISTGSIIFMGNDNERVPLLPSEQQRKQQRRNEEPDIGGWELFQDLEAITIGSTKLLMAGVGLMYINNVGTIIKTLYLSTHDDDAKEIQKFQNLHVALISISSCLGRISVGLMSDLAKYNYNVGRIWFLLAACWYIFIGQMLVGFIITDLSKLWIGTILIGFGYGNTFGIITTITSEWFGSKRFGIN
ncbi:7059_t:CDS:2, partial [Funneliformis mosseae]